MDWQLGSVLIWNTMGGLQIVTPDSDRVSSPAFRGVDSGGRPNDDPYTKLGHYLATSLVEKKFTGPSFLTQT